MNSLILLEKNSVQNSDLNKKTIKMKHLLSILVLFAWVSCAPIKNLGKEESHSSLNNTHWVLDEGINSQNKITLNIENDNAYGNASCNNYFGAVSFDSSSKSFSIKNVGVTRKDCGKISAENHFLELLDEVNKYKISKENLELYKDNVLLLKFRKK